MNKLTVMTKLQFTNWLSWLNTSLLYYNTPTDSTDFTPVYCTPRLQLTVLHCIELQLTVLTVLQCTILQYTNFLQWLNSTSPTDRHDNTPVYYTTIHQLTILTKLQYTNWLYWQCIVLQDNSWLYSNVLFSNTPADCTPVNCTPIHQLPVLQCTVLQ